MVLTVWQKVNIIGASFSQAAMLASCILLSAGRCRFSDVFVFFFFVALSA